MTPGARVAAAIAILDDIAAGQSAEQTLTRWGRQNRYAGSKDRAAVRDHVFDVLRRKRSAAAFGGGSDGRALMLGILRQDGLDVDELFSGEGHAPARLSEAERGFEPPTLTKGEVWNLPDWLVDVFQSSLGDHAGATALALQTRAPVTLRVNLARTTVDQAREALRAEGIETELNTLTDAALTVTAGSRKIRQSALYANGLLELQDAASQAVVALIPPGGRVLDFCAGGGGKSLALAMDPTRSVYAHDANVGRMRDLPERASRAGVVIERLTDQQISDAPPFDVVLCDVPCSGSGAWRRNPDAKWVLSHSQVDALTKVQDTILDQAAQMLRPGGVLVFATCSVLEIENEARVARFLARHRGWHCRVQRRFDVDQSGDGFFTAQLSDDYITL